MRRVEITDEYEEKLAEFAEASGDVTRAQAERAFRAYCEEFRADLKDDTPAAVIRRIAFHKLEWDPPGGEPSAGNAGGSGAGPESDHPDATDR